MEDSVSKQYSLLLEKLKYLREAYVIESDTIAKFKLKKQIENLEKEREKVEEELMKTEINSNSKTMPKLHKDIVFVIMPLRDQYTKIYTEIIKPIVTQFGYECIKADDIAKPGNINKEIAEYIARSIFIIADLTDSNPNVMYELGLSHALGRVTIMISQDISSLPFDISTYRVIEYSDSDDGTEKLKRKLYSFIENSDVARNESNNPVSEFLGRVTQQSPTEYLMTPIECFSSLCQTLEAFIAQKQKDEDVKLLRALPTEMTPKSFSNKGASNILIEKYESLMREYIMKPDLDDATIFGCPPTLKCIEETLLKIKSSYFPYPTGETSKLMEVSAIGFYPYLKDYSLFLLGKRKKWQNEPKQYDTGFIFFLNNQGFPINGIHTQDEQTIRILLHLWNLTCENITHEADGVKPKKYPEYRITQKNHETLFQNSIARSMLAKFNQINNTNWQLRVSKISDSIELI